MILLDTREFDHPVPLEMAVKAFQGLEEGEIVHMIHRREPLPLFEIIVKNGGDYRSQQDEEGIWHIYFGRKANLEPYRV